MKKMSFVYGIVIGICIFWLSLLELDNDISKQISSLALDEQTTSFYFEGEIFESTKEVFFNEFLNIIYNNKSSIYQAHISEDKYYIYAFSVDKNFIENFFIKDIVIEDLIDFPDLFNNYNVSDGLLYDPIITYDLRILPIKNSFNDPYFNYQGTYIINTKDYLNLEEELLNFTNFFPTVELKSQDIIIPIEPEEIVLTNYLIIALLIISYLIMLLTNTIKESTKISILKQEGYSNLQIYVKYCLKYIIIASIITILMTYILYIYYIPSYVVNDMFINLLLLFNIFVIFFSFLLSIVIFYSLMRVPINEYIKGKSYLSMISNLLRYIKVGLMLISYPLIIFILLFAVVIAQNFIKKENYFEQFNDVYKIHSVKSVYLSELSREEDLKELNAFLEKDLNLFMFNLSDLNYSLDLFSDDLSNYSHSNVYYADYNYAKLQGVDKYINKFKDKDEIVLVGKDFDFNKCVNEEVCNKEFVLIDFKKEKLKNYQYLLNTYENQYIKYPDVTIGLNDMIIIGDYSNSPYGKSFIFKGDTITAQQVLDKKLHDYGFNPLFNIISISETSKATMKYFLLSSTKLLISGTLVILIFILLTIQITIISIKSNYEKKILMKYEGYNIFQLWKKDFVNNFIEYVFLAFILIVLLKNNFNKIVAVSCFLFLIDTLIYAMINKRRLYGNTTKKYK